MSLVTTRHRRSHARGGAARPRAGAVLALAAGLALAGCSNSPTGEKDVRVTGPVQSLGAQPSASTTGTPGASGSASSTASPTGGSSNVAPTGPGESTQPPEPPNVVVKVTGRTVTPPPARVEISAGQPVRITVTSDVDNVVHVHGAEVERPVKANQPLTFQVTVDQAGTYEVELHEPQLLLFKISVR